MALDSEIQSILQDVREMVRSKHSWEYKYDHVLGYAMRMRLENADITLDYADPDTSYEEDVMAFYNALEAYCREGA